MNGRDVLGCAETGSGKVNALAGLGFSEIFQV